MSSKSKFLQLIASGAAGVKQALSEVHAHKPSGLATFNDIIVKRAEGCWVYTSDGQKYLDLASGIGVTSTGHCHPRVVEAVRKQAGLVVHAQQNLFAAHEAGAEAVEKLVSVLPRPLGKVLLTNSGAEAVENAVKIARAATGRDNVIAFDGGFHGRTYGAMALTSSKTIYRQGFGPVMPGAFIAPYPYCLHCKAQQCQGHAGYPLAPDMEPFSAGPDGGRSCCGGPLEALEWMLHMQTHPSDTAAIIIEPVLGEGGFLTPPPGYLKALRQLCTKHGILMIADEVQAGAGRTGRWWGHQHWMDAEAPPDLLVFAKGIASGYPLAGVAARGELFEGGKMPPGTLGGTYGGNAVACAAASATIDVINDEDLCENATRRGQQLMQGLMDLAKEVPAIIDVRGRGLMVGVEFGGLDGNRCAPAPKGLASAITKACAKRHMLLMAAGARESVRFLPPLTINEAEVALALDIFRAAVKEAVAAAK